MLSGVRPGEALALTAEKISVLDRSLKVDGQIGQHGGLKATKTGESRTVDVSSKLLAILTSLFHVGGERPAGPWLFYPELGPNPSEKDAQRVYKNALRAMRRCLKAAGLPTYFGLHALRHTYGSGLISQGVSPAYVQAQMGHASIQQTVDTYGSWFPPRVPGAVDALAESFAPRLGHSMDTRGTLAGVTES
jgi:integrase